MDRRTDTDDIELETTLQELALNLRRDAVETNMAVGVDSGLREGRHRDEGKGRSWETVLCSESEDYFFCIPRKKKV